MDKAQIGIGIVDRQDWTAFAALRPADWLRRLAAGIALAHTRARQRRALARLEPDLLRDIGITPEQARREAAKPSWRA
jgi:uncharacterized protein YjiS (DUF1127 family)